MAIAIDRLHEIRGDEIGEALHRGAGALRLGHHVHDLREQRVRADALGADDERSLAVDRRAGHLVCPASWAREPARR